MNDPFTIYELSDTTAASSIQFSAYDIVTSGSQFLSNISGTAQNPINSQTGATGRLKASVVLPAPPVFSFRYDADWEKVTFGQLGAAVASADLATMTKDILNSISARTLNEGTKGLIKSFAADKIINMVKGTDPFKALSAGSRITISTKETTKQLFREMKPRTFNFTFSLVPRNKQEADKIKSIAKIFRYYMHPYIAGNLENTTLKIVNYPAVWNIDVLGLRGNKHIPLINQCVLTSYAESFGVDKSGTSVLSEDGYPMQTKIDLNFTEITLLDRSDIAKDSAGEGSIADMLTSL